MGSEQPQQLETAGEARHVQEPADLDLVAGRAVHGDELEERGHEALPVHRFGGSERLVGHGAHASAWALIFANSSGVIAPESSSALAWASCSTPEEPDDGVATLRM